MSKQVTMIYRREYAVSTACLEYSWVPEGKRHVIMLAPGQKEGTRTDTIDDTLKPSHVQVYRLDNNKQVSIQMWQFPPGPPYSAAVVGALVYLPNGNTIAEATVKYADNTSATDQHPLDHIPRPCPESPGGGGVEEPRKP